MRTILAFLILSLLLPTVSTPAPASAPHHARSATKTRLVLLSLPLPAIRSVHRRLTKNLLLRIDANGDGYDLAVYRLDHHGRLISDDNLLYHSLEWHGPCPAQIYAWHFATPTPYFPRTRILPIRNHPDQLRVTVENPAVAGPRTSCHFTSGHVQIRLERTPK